LLPEKRRGLTLYLDESCHRKNGNSSKTPGNQGTIGTKNHKKSYRKRLNKPLNIHLAEEPAVFFSFSGILEKNQA
tara:strand:- start:35 stop:259 length:225 start_codon:yes stop_codon:yes gene_type:complete